nr:MAG TPA: hypothetical protein [Bacteriophage sp.]
MRGWQSVITRLTRHARNIGLCPHRKNPRFYRGVPFRLEESKSGCMMRPEYF